jgi:hypothetical protein
MERSSALSHLIRPSSEFPFVFHYRQFDGLRLAHLDEGAGAAVVCIHGRFSFDRATGDMVIADVGEGAEEEIDFAHPGGCGTRRRDCWSKSASTPSGSPSRAAPPADDAEPALTLLNASIALHLGEMRSRGAGPSGVASDDRQVAFALVRADRRRATAFVGGCRNIGAV